MPAVRDALSVPEILMNVLDHLASDKKTLKSALLVNSLWADLATDILWKEPPPSALLAVPNSRRQYYSSKIRTLEFTGVEGFYHYDFRNLSFPRLASLTMDHVPVEVAAPVAIEQYLQPNLRELVAYGGQFPGRFLWLLVRQCPLLETFLLEEWILPQGTQVSENDFISFLENMPSLKDVTFAPGLPAAVAPKTFSYLAEREGLEEMEISRAIPSQEMESIERTVPGAFNSLHTASLRLESAAVPVLVRMANELESLDLTITDNQIDIWTSIHHFSDLYDLYLFFEATTPLSVHSLAGIGRLQNLQTLSIWGKPCLQCLAFDDNDFERLISQLCDLEDLELHIQCSLTVSALKALGGHCPDLSICELLGSYDIRSLQDVEPPLFPKLEELSVGRALPDARYAVVLLRGAFERSKERRTSWQFADKRSPTPKPRKQRAAEMACIIRRHAPKLKELQLTNGDPFSKAVVQAFKEQSGTVYYSYP